MSELGWRVGVELELMAPRGRSRRDLAERLAGAGGQVQTFFHPQSEPSLVEGTPVFESLTLGFRAINAQGQPVADLVDDLTLRDRLDPKAPPVQGWYRIVSDQLRLLHLVRRLGSADGSMADAIGPTAAIFGTTPQPGPGGMLRVSDEIGTPICIAAPLPGERERPCEVVTPPITHALEERLEALLEPARSMGFYVPAEAATHIHLEAAPLESAHAVANLVELLHTWGDALKALVRTNPRCVRLGPLPLQLLQTVRATDFHGLAWPGARARLAALGLSKYVDFNLKNLAHPRPDKPTFEARIFPGSIQADPVVDQAALMVAIARRATGAPVGPRPPRDDLAALWRELDTLDDGVIARLTER